jgi:hypothetical protein
MDTLSATPTPDADTRLADLERQLAELRAQFHAMTFGLEHACAAGRASITNPRTAAPALFPRPRHLRVVGGGER